MAARTILVGFDLSEPSIVAAQWTARHLDGESTLVLAHAICVPEPPSFLRQLYPPTEPLIENARRGAAIRLAEFARRMSHPQLRAEVRVGRPEDVLTTLAEELGAELVVVGLHGQRNGLWRVLGSTAERVVRRTGTSVLLARRLPEPGLRTVLCALDESDLTPLVLEWTMRLAKPTGARIVFAHVARSSHAVAIDAVTRRDFEEGVRARATDWMRSQAGVADEGRTSVDVVFGDPAFELLELAERARADLIVIGHHGVARAPTGCLGSVAEFLMRNATRPVLIVERPVE